jgi:hypothetical protein
MTMTSEVRPESVQPHFGQAQASRLGTLPTGLSFVINGTEVVRDTYGQLNTDLERQAFFDEFLKNQRRGFPSAWVAIYETVDLIRQADWYWKGQGFDSFDAFWQQQGEQLFGRWADLEATYQYAHLAAPHLFEVEYSEAQALAQQLWPFREVQPAMDPRAVRVEGGKARAQQKRDYATASPVNLGDYVPDMNPPEWLDGFKEGVKAKKSPGEDRYRRFARLRRDAPDIADRFLAGEFVRKFKNGTIQPDLVAAEVEAGIRKEGQPARQRDGLAYARKLISKFSKDDLRALQQHITTLLQQD